MSAFALKGLVGTTTPAVHVDVEKGQVRRFARAIGETNPIHHDDAAARAAGFRAIVATPTFAASLFALEPLYALLDLDPHALMHAEEEYEYFRPLCAGDCITLTHALTDAYEKEGGKGRLIFWVIETRASDGHRRPVFKGRRVMVEMKP